MENFMHESNFVFISSMLQSIQFEISEHFGWTTSISPVILDKSSSFTLDHFEFGNVGTRVGVPYNGAIFEDWTDISFVTLQFNIRIAGSKVRLQKTSRLVCFLYGVVDMCIPG